MWIHKDFFSSTDALNHFYDSVFTFHIIIIIGPLLIHRFLFLLFPYKPQRMTISIKDIRMLRVLKLYIIKIGWNRCSMNSILYWIANLCIADWVMPYTFVYNCISIIWIKGKSLNWYYSIRVIFILQTTEIFLKNSTPNRWYFELS